MSLKVETDSDGKFFRCVCGNSAFEIRLTEKKLVERPSSGVLDVNCRECKRTYPLSSVIGYVTSSISGRFPRGVCITSV